MDVIKKNNINKRNKKITKERNVNKCMRMKKNILRLFLYLFYFYFYDIIYFVISPEAVNGGYNYIDFYDSHKHTVRMPKTQITDYFSSTRTRKQGKEIFAVFSYPFVKNDRKHSCDQEKVINRLFHNIFSIKFPPF